MPAKRGRTITTFGALFTPIGLSGGAQFVPPVPPVTTDVSGGGHRPTKVQYADWYIEYERRRRKRKREEEELLILD